ncbi:MAG: hypothetical protein U9N14_05535, partial [Pseudomonadota bacterium]|nr:hypothetical protein [Pseudomonadota bacterium]
MRDWLYSAWRGRASHIASAYKHVFSGQAGRDVLRDLALYGNALTTSFKPDPYETAFNEGARDMFNHIAGMLGLRPLDLMRMFGGFTQ